MPLFNETTHDGDDIEGEFWTANGGSIEIITAKMSDMEDSSHEEWGEFVDFTDKKKRKEPTFHEQMKKAREEDDGRNIRDYPSWTIQDYRDFMFCVEKGYLILWHDVGVVRFMINEFWEGEDIYAEEFLDEEDEECDRCGRENVNICHSSKCIDHDEEEEEMELVECFYCGKEEDPDEIIRGKKGQACGECRDLCDEDCETKKKKKFVVKPKAWEANCKVCDDYMSDVDKEDYDEGCNNICDNCCDDEEEEEDALICGNVVDDKVIMGCGGKTYRSEQGKNWQYNYFAYCKDCSSE